MLKKSEKSVVLLLQHDQPYKQFGTKIEQVWLPYLAAASERPVLFFFKMGQYFQSPAFLEAKYSCSFCHFYFTHVALIREFTEHFHDKLGANSIWEKAEMLLQPLS